MDMDVRLLEALSNLSFALEQIAESLKDGASAKSDVAKALSGGDFFKVISEIKVGIDELKESVSEVSVKQDTILEMTKENSKKLDVQTDLIRKQGNILQGIQTEIKSKRDKNPIDTTNEKNQSGIKKGIATILLIAVAVLAIGAAFKLIGGVNFLSVIALSAGIFLIALAFERIAKMNIEPKQAIQTSLLMVIMAGGIMVSSWFLSMVSPITIPQFLTSVAVAGLFYFVMPVMMDIMDSMMNPITLTLPNGTKIKTKKLNVGKLIATAVFLPILMFTMSLGIMLASRVLAGVRPMSIGQIITSLLISGMFAIALPALGRTLDALSKSEIGLSKVFQASLVLPLLLLAVSVAIMLSSYVLGLIKPVSFGKAITAILIAGMFAVISFGINKLLSAFQDINPVDALAAAFIMPILLTAISIAVMLSSWALSMVVPVGFPQFLTALGISIIFIAFSFAIKIMARSISRINPAMIPLIPVLFTSFSLAILASSWLLSMVKPITMTQFLTSLAISAIFVVCSFAIKLMGRAIRNFNMKDVWKIPILYTAISLAIMLSSQILNLAADIPAGKALRLLLFSLTLSVSIVLVAIAMKILNRLNLKISDIVKGGLIIVAIATVIMLTSLILSVGKYDSYPGLGWSIGVSASLLAFGIGALALGTLIGLTGGAGYAALLIGLGSILTIAVGISAVSFILAAGVYDKYPTIGWATGVALIGSLFGIAALGLGVAILGTLGLGYVALEAGLSGILLIATTIVATSYILAAGKYDKYPTFGWITSVGLVGTGFGLGALALGVAILGTFGLGMLALEAGLTGILLIAATIVATSYILAAGKYDKYPTVAWTASVGLAATAFGLPALALGVAILGTLGLGAIALSLGLSSIESIAETIVEVSKIFGKGNYSKYPTVTWTASVGLAATAFGLPALELGIAIMTTLGLGRLALGIGLSAIEAVAETIVNVSKILGKGNYGVYPSPSWTGSVGLAATAFGLPALALGTAIMATLGLGRLALGIGLSAIETIAETIVKVDKILSKGQWNKGPTVEWSKGVAAALGAFMPVYEILSDSNGWFISGPSVEDFAKAIKTIASGIEIASKSLSNQEVYKNGPTKEWAAGISSALKAFSPIYQMLADSDDWFNAGPSIEDFSGAIEAIATGIGVAARTLSGQDIYKNGPTVEWADGVSSSLKAFSPIYKMLADSDGWFSSGPSIEDFSGAIEAIATGIGVAARALSGQDIYTNGPTVEWADGVSTALKAFSPIYKMLSDEDGWFSSGPSIDDFSNAIETIAIGIGVAASALASSPGVYTNGPTEEWASGVSTALKAFSPIYKMLADSDGWFSSGPTIEAFSGAIEAIATGISKAASVLASSPGVYTNGPTQEWASGVSTALKAFSPIYKMLADSDGWFEDPPTVESFAGAIEAIATGISKAASVLASSPGVYTNGPTVEWAEGVSKSLKAFSPIYKMLADSDGWFEDPPTVESFAGAIEAIATGISRAASVLASSPGVYTNGPTPEWATGVTKALKAFSPIYKMLANSDGWFEDPPTVEAFSGAIEAIATGISKAASVLASSPGVYTNGPTKEWAEGVSKSLEAFSPIYKMLADSSRWLSSAPDIDKFSGAIEAIATGITKAASIFAGNPSVYVNGPTSEWAAGVSAAVEAFSPVYKMLSDSASWFKSAPKVEDFVGAISSISTAIIESANIFAGSPGVYVNGPTKEWAAGVSAAVEAFSPVYKMLSDSASWFKSAPDTGDFVDAIVAISKGIIESANAFAGSPGVYVNGPTSEWAAGVSSAVGAFSPVYKMLSDSASWFKSAPDTEDFVDAIVSISTGIVSAAKVFAENPGVYVNGPTAEWASGVSSAIEAFSPIYKMLKGGGLFDSFDVEDYTSSIESVAKTIKKVSNIFNQTNFTNYPSKDWSNGTYFAFKMFKKILGLTSLFDFIKISNLKRLVSSMKSTATSMNGIKYNNASDKSLKSMIANIKDFVKLRDSVKTIKFGKSSLDTLVNEIIRVSKKFRDNYRNFAVGIPGNYVKKMSSNILDYVDMLKKVNQAQKSGLISSSMNNKTINNITDGIVKMSKSFDKLSKSLSKFTSSIKNIDTAKLRQLNTLTANITTLSGVDSKSLDNVLKVLESKSTALSKILGSQGASVSSGVNTKKATAFGKPKKSPEEVKLDMIVKLLYNLNSLFSPGSTFDDFIFKKMSEKGGGGAGK